MPWFQHIRFYSRYRLNIMGRKVVPWWEALNVFKQLTTPVSTPANFPHPRISRRTVLHTMFIRLQKMPSFHFSTYDHQLHFLLNFQGSIWFTHMNILQSTRELPARMLKVATELQKGKKGKKIPRNLWLVHYYSLVFWSREWNAIRLKVTGLFSTLSDVNSLRSYKGWEKKI